MSEEFIKSLNGLHCIMYVYNRTYIYSLMVLKDTELPFDVVHKLFIDILRVNNYPFGYLCKKYATFTEWSDLRKGFCSGTCHSCFHNYPSSNITINPAFKINKPRFGKKVPINIFNSIGL